MKNLLTYSYYPGCSLHASGKEYDESNCGRLVQEDAHGSDVADTW